MITTNAKSKHVLEVDFSDSLAKTVTTCDNCGEKIGTSYASYDKLTTRIPLNETDYGDKHFCGIGCLGSFVDKQDEKDGIVHDYTDEEKNAKDDDAPKGKKEAKARYISTQKRNHLKSSQFVDEKRRSFPIENCTDVHAAVHAWGRYKGSISFEEFKEKVTRKAHALGCSLPKSWEAEKK